MKPLIKLIFFFFLGAQNVFGQDTVIHLTQNMFNPINEIPIYNFDGWEFRKEGDSTWIKLKPTELSVKQADGNKRVEGWLRFQFTLSPEFSNTELGLRYYGWAASQLYLDGKLLGSFGTIGTDKHSFREHNPSNKMPILVNLKPGIIHEISIHFADYVSPFSVRQLKSNAIDQKFIYFTGQSFNEKMAKHINEWPIYSTVWASVSLVLSLFFWMLVFLNKREKNLILFALSASILLFQICSFIFSEDDNISFNVFTTSSALNTLFYSILIGINLIIVARVFKEKVAGWLKVAVMMLILSGVANMFLFTLQLYLLVTLIPVLIYLWYIISSSKTLKGAQWSIVIGLLIYSFMTLLFLVIAVTYKTFFIPYNNLIGSVGNLSFPLSLLVYVAIRFKEIISDVRKHADQVLKLSEEKKEEALNQQKILQEEVTRQTAEIRTTLDNLKSTQAQLIQSEKMASLGELTAGIAHEIQNPLNFVNNFSEVSNELIVDMVDEVDKGNYDEVKAIARDVQQNLTKINHHGKRASSIIKGMLEHSRKSTGEKELTDINALCDEYFRLAYNGLKAKNKNFNATMETHFDPTLPKIEIIPQDIGRVLLNLITNAFYAVNERANLLNLAKHGSDANLKDLDYQPTVTITTRLTPKTQPPNSLINQHANSPTSQQANLPTSHQANSLIIAIKDNGSGIPDTIKEKIFQPFFTTKPTGQGTGLGLSLAYDIVKAHGGELKVETTDGAGSEFVIQLPIN